MTMRKNDIIRMMGERGFTYDKKVPGESAYRFLSEPVYDKCGSGTAAEPEYMLTVPSFACIVYPNTDEFAFEFVIAKSEFNKLDTFRCGPVGNDEFFSRICVRFERAVQALYEVISDYS